MGLSPKEDLRIALQHEVAEVPGSGLSWLQ